MRIAVLFSGRIAGYKNNYKSIIENLVNGNEADFFLSHSPELDEDLGGFIDLYNPVILNNDEIKYTDITKYLPKPGGCKHRIMCMFFNRKRVFEDLKKYMKENKKEYDLYISCRVDVSYIDKLDFKIFQDCRDNDIFIPNIYDYEGINDQFAIGNLKAMEKYMLVYDEIINMINYVTIVYPEIILLTYLQKNEINIHRFDLLYKLNS